MSSPIAMSNPPTYAPAGPMRRLGAMLYDTLLVIAVLMVATLPFLPFVKDKVLVPSEAGALAYVYRLWQVAMIAFYFGFFWCAKGRTLGMQAWRLRIERNDSPRVTWSDAFKRFACASLPWMPAFVVMAVAEHGNSRDVLMPIGTGLLAIGLLNYLAAYWTEDRRAWHERKLQTRIVVTKE